MGEASLTHMPVQLRQLFVLICVFNTPNIFSALYHLFEESMMEDFLQDHDRAYSVEANLSAIENALAPHGLKCRDLGLPSPTNLFAEQNHELHENPVQRVATLTQVQLQVFSEVVSAVQNTAAENRFYFLDGPGGSGKTYVYNTLIKHLQDQGKSVLSFATTGIAADLLTGGRTVHSGLKILF